MRIQFLQFLALFKQLFVVFSGALGKLGSALFDYGLVFGLEEYHNGVILGIVQLIYVVWGHVQQTVFSLINNLFDCTKSNDS